jgi:hypothetical protein
VTDAVKTDIETDRKLGNGKDVDGLNMEKRERSFFSRGDHFPLDRLPFNGRPCLPRAIYPEFYRRESRGGWPGSPKGSACARSHHRRDVIKALHKEQPRLRPVSFRCASADLRASSGSQSSGAEPAPQKETNVSSWSEACPACSGVGEIL